MTKESALGQRMKGYERHYAGGACLPMVPMLCRIDGKAFHTFTRGLNRPYDERLSRLMVATTKFLVEETHAKCGYTQSDEISLVWMQDDAKSEMFMGGRVSKVVSITASMATWFFNRLLPERIFEKSESMAFFDSRVWSVPSPDEAANYFIWREQDATRNSILMAADSYYSPREMYKKNTSELQEMLFRKGVNWNDYPRFFKRGTYVRRRTVERPFTAEELEALPPKHEYRTKPDLIVKRSVVMEEDFPVFTRIANRAEVILAGADPKGFE